MQTADVALGPAGADGTARPGQALAERYAIRAADARRALAAAEARSRRLSAARLVTALTAGAAGLWALQSEGPAAAGWLALTLAAGFFVLVAVHDRVERRADWHRAHVELNDEARHRAARAWDELPSPAIAPADPHHPFAADLDLFGHASLFELIGPPGTAMGRQTLSRWLLEPAPPHRIPARQRAVGELAADLERRQTIAAHARLVGRSTTFDLNRFLEWATSGPWLHARPWLSWLVRGLTAATPLLAAAQAAGGLEVSWWLLTLTAGLVVSWAAQRPLDRALGRSGAWEPAVRASGDLLRCIERAPWQAPELVRLQDALGSASQKASREIARFERIVALADLRHAPLLHFPVQAVTLWDFHVCDLLERWQARAGPHVRGWLDAVGEVEALGALAGLAHDHPDWAWPEIDPLASSFEAEALGHPLIAEDLRVANDVRVGPPGRVLCVTGSNMSGKSTLLRAIGVNAVLAQAGAPVCATRLRLPPVRLYTSLRVGDSLEEGVSYFMAALARLRSLVTAATEAGWHAAGDGPVVLYLLDEILQGTNTAEREIAVRHIVGHLTSCRAIGAITTHDLGLTATPELRAAGDHVHFTESVGEGADPTALTFDYRLRPGVATSRNALRLMQLVGLVTADEMRSLSAAVPGIRLDPLPPER